MIIFQKSVKENVLFQTVAVINLALKKIFLKIFIH